jgi:hypothetical protein
MSASTCPSCGDWEWECEGDCFEAAPLPYGPTGDDLRAYRDEVEAMADPSMADERDTEQERMARVAMGRAAYKITTHSRSEAA